jgi:hypothetical protein
MRFAAVLAWLAGIGFGLPGAYGAAYLTSHGEVWIFHGVPTYGGGPFQDWGLPTLLMQMAFVLVCVAELVCGNLLWLRRPAGRTMSLALLPVEVFFWFGFALSFGFILGALRAALTVVRVPPPPSPSAAPPA